MGIARMPDSAITAARFSITVDGYQIGSFNELAGLSAEADVVEYIESEDELRLLMVGGRQPPVLNLSRPRTTDNKLRAWYDSVVRTRPPPRKTCTLTMYDQNDRPVAKYYLENAWPAKVAVGPHATEGSAEMRETLTLKCDRVRRG
jgi:phage tail-like protein